MKAFVINLERSIDRKIILEERAKKVGLNIEFIKAVDGRELSEAEVKLHTRPLNYAFLRGEVGCALSHQKIYKKIIDDNIPYALILEDDITLPEDIVNILNSLQVKNDKPYIILLSRVNKYIKAPIKNIDRKHALHKTQQATTAHAYIINEKAAQKMLEFMYPVWMVADKWDFLEDHSIAHIDCVVPAPILLNEHANASTINNQKGNPDTNKRKKETWNQIMKERPFLAKLKHRYRRAIVPIFNKITDQGKGDLGVR
jgi:glycosyl transferase family 25